VLASVPLLAQQPDLRHGPATPGAAVSSALPTPEAHFGFPMGADRRLAAAGDIERYFETAAARSDRVELVDIGATTDGHRTIAAIISAPQNIRNLEQIRAANEQLADARGLQPDQARRLAAGHKAIVAIGCSIHATEIGASQAASELLFELATSNDPLVERALGNVVVILIPMLNPDGHRRVVDWYNTHLGTPFEGGPMPWADHRYVGHDINRDAFMMNLAESRNLSRFFYTEWHPQVFLTMHQMEPGGARFFAPPNEDPINPNYDPIIWREAGLLGSAMTLELERDGHAGVLSNALYDYYWPGYEDSAPLGHNTVGLLTEAARVKVATPIALRPEELRGGQKGFAYYGPHVNFPNPWPGGSWTLRHIVDYDLSAVRGLLRAASAYREEIVRNFYEMGRRAVEAGGRGAPFAFIVPPEQFDRLAAARLKQVLLDSGVEIHHALEPFRADGEPYNAGSDIILMAQPYRAYVKTLLERQDYPRDRSAPSGRNGRPYDVVAWTLPAQMGVDVRTIERWFEVPATSRMTSAAAGSLPVWGERKPAFYVVDGRATAGAIAANRLLAASAQTGWLTAPLEINGYGYGPGSLVVPGDRVVQPVVEDIARELGLRVDGVRGKRPATMRPLSQARVGLYRPWFELDDEGWTRWILERYEFPFSTLRDEELRAGDLRSRFDAIVLPSAPPEWLVDGQPGEQVPPEYAGGLGEAGVLALVAFVQAGGTLVCLDEAGGLAIDAFKLPLRDVAREHDTELVAPGSIVRVELDPRQPLSYGMPAQVAGFFSFSSAYEILEAPAGGLVPAARYAERDLVLSGWIDGEQTVAGRAAIVEASVGAGRVVLLGFRVQHRGQSLATFRLLFNALFTAR
jgi:hypothetical protein